MVSLTSWQGGGVPSMAAEEIWLKIEGRPGDVDAAALQRGIEALLVLLRSSGVDGFVVTDLRIGSLELAVKPRLPTEDVAARFSEIVSSLEALQEGDIPNEVQPGFLEGVVDFRQVLDL